jgi:hypothetical protein
MPTINVEMMQKLLQEFTDKETLTGEEIKVIEEQVHELEGRIGMCRERLQNLNEDKDRLAQMMSRYVGNANPSSSSARSGAKAKAATKPLERPQAMAASVADNQSTSASNKDAVIEELELAPGGEAGQTETDKQGAGGDDAIKSINDALKGLFRK